jgi:hypothetical protein
VLANEVPPRMQEGLMALQIRQKTRIQASPPRGLSQEWTEWQVVDGRKVVARYGTKAEAEKAIQGRQ